MVWLQISEFRLVAVNAAAIGQTFDHKSFRKPLLDEIHGSVGVSLIESGVIESSVIACPIFFERIAEKKKIASSVGNFNFDFCILTDDHLSARRLF